MMTCKRDVKVAQMGKMKSKDRRAEAIQHTTVTKDEEAGAAMVIVKCCSNSHALRITGACRITTRRTLRQREANT